MIQAQFGLPDIAVRTMEVYTTATLEATLTPAVPPTPDWRAVMEGLADTSRASYRAIVYEHRERGIDAIRVLRRQGDGWVAAASLGVIAGNPAAANPRFSPNGRLVSYSDNGTIRVAPSFGGDTARIAFGRADAFAILSNWSPSGRSLYVLAVDSSSAVLWEAPLDGAPRQLFRFSERERQPTRYGLEVREEGIYFTQGERQADISVVTLGRQD